MILVSLFLMGAVLLGLLFWKWSLILFGIGCALISLPACLLFGKNSCSIYSSSSYAVTREMSPEQYEEQRRREEEREARHKEREKRHEERRKYHERREEEHNARFNAAGFYTHSNREFDSLTTTGGLALDNCRAGRACVTGPADFTSTTIESLTVTGAASLKNCQITERAVITGALTTHRTTFEGNLQVTGPLSFSDKSTAEKVKVTGNGELNDSQITEILKITGNLKATRSSLAHLCGCLSSVELYDSRCGTIEILESQGWFPNEQVIHLYGATHIEGTITFESKKGKVFIHDARVVITGEVRGGEVIIVAPEIRAS